MPPIVHTRSFESALAFYLTLGARNASMHFHSYPRPLEMCRALPHTLRRVTECYNVVSHNPNLRREDTALCLACRKTVIGDTQHNCCLPMVGRPGCSADLCKTGGNPGGFRIYKMRRLCTVQARISFPPDLDILLSQASYTILEA